MMYRLKSLKCVGGVSKRQSTPCLEKPSEVTRCQTSSSVASTHSLVCAVPEHSGWISPSNNQTESNIPVSKQNCYIGKIYCKFLFLKVENIWFLFQSNKPITIKCSTGTTGFENLTMDLLKQTWNSASQFQVCFKIGIQINLDLKSLIPGLNLYLKS